MAHCAILAPVVSLAVLAVPAPSDPFPPEQPTSHEIWLHQSDPRYADLFLRFWSDVKRMIAKSQGYSWLREHHVELDEIANDVFIRAQLDSRLSQNGFEHRAPGSLRAYLRRIAHSAITDRIRAGNTLKRGGSSTPVSLDAETPTGSAFLQPAVRPASPGTEAHARLLESDILADLTDHERVLFHLRCVERLEFTEIAQRLGTTPSAARSAFDRLRDRDAIRRLDPCT
jgi:RNA polymerase sigma factor (sigma-70 family)